MSTEKATAIVIKLADFSETSRVVTFYTREFGRFSALAKGAKRLKGPFDAALDLLSLCRVVFIRKSSTALHLLTEARLESRFRPPGSDLTRLYGGYYVADLLRCMTEEEDAAEAVFDQAQRTLEQLSDESFDPLTSIVRFELALLRESGLLPNLDCCTICGQPITIQHTTNYWVSQGGLLCESCRRQDYAGSGLSAGTVAVLRQLSSADSPLSERISFSKTQLQQSHKFAVSAISNVLGRRPATLKYLGRI